MHIPEDCPDTNCWKCREIEDSEIGRLEAQDELPTPHERTAEALGCGRCEVGGCTALATRFQDGQFLCRQHGERTAEAFGRKA